jgi:thiol-disulfide isomerase/thioredoxin
MLASFLCLTAVVSAATLPRPTPDITIHTPSGPISPAQSQYKGKVVLLAFIQTTCPHCQHATGILSGLQKQYARNGLRVLASAFNDKAEVLVPGFIQQFQPAFPVGSNTHQEVLTYLNHSVMQPLFVPTMVFIDRKGMIRYQYLGGDPFFNDLEKNLHDTIETLLKEPAIVDQVRRHIP